MIDLRTTLPEMTAHFETMPLDKLESLLEKYQPEIWEIKKDLVDKIIPCLEAGLENTQSALVEHDAALGRTTTKNRMWAETLEQEIRDMEDCIKQLRMIDVSNSTHYP